MDDITEFIAVLNAECGVLKKDGVMLKSVGEPWRYYSPPLDDQHEFDPLRAVLEAGKFIVEAESYAKADDELSAWRALARAQRSLLKSLSAKGKADAKKHGQSKGGQAKNETLYYEVFCIADDLLLSDNGERGLARKIIDKLGDRYQKNENQIRDILKKQKHLRVNR